MRLNRRQKRAAGIKQSKFGAWVDSAPEAPVRRGELEKVLNVAITHAVREYHDRNAPIRVIARGLGYAIGVLIWPVRRLVRYAGRVVLYVRLKRVTRTL